MQSDNALAIRNEQQLAIPAGTEPATAQLVQWAQAATAAYQFAEAVCNSQAVPSAYRGKPQEAAAAILAGAEVGMSPMASLRAFDNIQGTPAPKALTLRAIVQGRGHDLEVIEADARHAVIEGRRKGSDRWQRLEWTIERAITAGYVAKNPKWKSDPTSMLVARATAEMARWIDSAAIMGMPYSAEEIRDKGAAIEAQPEPRRVTAAEILGTATAEPAQIASSAEPQSGDSAAAERTALTKAQQSDLSDLFNAVDITDRAARLQYVNEVLAEAYGPDRQVTSASELGEDEAETVIGKLRSWAAAIEPTAVEVADVVGDQR